MADTTTKTKAYSQITHIGSGASMSPGAFSASGDVSTPLVVSGNLNYAPMCDVVLVIAPTASVASTSTNLFLYRRDIDIVGTADEPVPGVSNRKKFMGALLVGAATTASTTHNLQICEVPLPAVGGCEFYVEDALGVNVPAGWSLYVTPRTETGATT